MRGRGKVPRQKSFSVKFDARLQDSRASPSRFPCSPTSSFFPLLPIVQLLPSHFLLVPGHNPTFHIRWSKLSNFQLQFSTWDLCRVSACLPHRFYQLSRKIRPHKNPNICDTICQNVLPPPRDLPDWSVPMHPVHRQPLASFPDAPGVSHNFMLKMDVYDDEGLRGLWPQDPRVCRAQIRFASIQLLKWSIGFNLVLTLLMDGRMETFPRTPF